MVSFLTTIIKRPDEDEWGDLKRLLEYLKGTKHMKLILRVYSLLAANWWVDASYNTHDDYRGNTGSMMSLGKGGILGSYMKQKLKVNIYTVGG